MDEEELDIKELLELSIQEASVVPKGDNPRADIVFLKEKPDSMTFKERIARLFARKEKDAANVKKASPREHLANQEMMRKVQASLNAFDRAFDDALWLPVDETGPALIKAAKELAELLEEAQINTKSAEAIKALAGKDPADDPEGYRAEAKSHAEDLAVDLAGDSESKDEEMNPEEIKELVKAAVAKAIAGAKTAEDTAPVNKRMIEMEAEIASMKKKEFRAKVKAEVAKMDLAPGTPVDEVVDFVAKARDLGGDDLADDAKELVGKIAAGYSMVMKALKSIGGVEVLDGPSDDTKLDKFVKEYAEKHDLSYAQAFSKAVRTEEGRKLYAEQRAEEAGE